VQNLSALEAGLLRLLAKAQQKARPG